MRTWLRVVGCGLVAPALVLLAACGGRSGPGVPTSSPSTSAVTTAPATSAAATSAPATTGVVTTSVTAGPTVPTTAPAATTTTTPPASSTEPTSPTPRLVDVKVYLLRGERLVIAHRQVAPPAVLRGALNALLAGPTDAERQGSLATAVPAGTSLLDVALEDGRATVDLSGRFGTGGGTASMRARLAQVVFTATQFANVDRVVFRMDGTPLEVLGGEGLVLSGPQRRMDSPRALTGAVLIDTPAYGSEVGRTFTVTGEGDVYEAQFPIEVWAGGRLVTLVAPVSAGAWGTWGPFSVTLTTDAPLGPIEVVAYDAGGCGDDPECPPIVRTVVPLVLVG